jgi:YVTN family beta-propeller protein
MKLYVPPKAIAISLMCTVLAACGNSSGGGSGNNILSSPRSATSGPIQVASDDNVVWVVSPSINSLTKIAVINDVNQVVANTTVGSQPANIVVSADGKRVFVANNGSDTVSVVDTTTAQPLVIKTINVGTEPWGMAITPNGKKLYVANSRSNNVSVIDIATLAVTKTIDDVGIEPRGVTITDNGDANDNDEKVYVTQFFAVDRPGVTIGADNYKEGRVAVINVGDDIVARQAVLNPMADTGFKSDGSALQSIPTTSTATGVAVTNKVTTGAFPNMMQAIVIKGSRAYLPNTCASPDGPVKFNVNIQSCLTVLDTTTDAEGAFNGASQSINMNRGINFEVADPGNELKRLFLAVPWAVAFKKNSNEGFAVSLSSNVLVKVRLDLNGTPSTGAPTTTAAAGAADNSGVVRILVGQGPRGIAINSKDTRAYVYNENSRNVSVINLNNELVVATVQTARLPIAGTEDAKILIGKAIFDSSTGVDLAELTSGPLSGTVNRFPARLSNEGWSSCYACHGFSKTDGVTWIFNTGPRRSSPLNGTFNPRDATDQKILNHGAIFDEVQDFELNIRNVSGGLGLITQSDGITPELISTIKAFDAATTTLSVTPSALINTGRSQQLDALALYVAKGISTPRSPLANVPPLSVDGARISEGRQLFGTANCASCHGGAGWSSARKDFVGAPGQPFVEDDIKADNKVNYLFKFVRIVGTFFSDSVNEIKQDGSKAAGVTGYVPPSLLGAHGLAPYLHNGSAKTLEEVMDLAPHRSAGTGGIDTLTSPTDRASLVRFLKSIDASTEPFPIP